MNKVYFQINIGTIRIHSIENASTMNIGKNWVREFDNKAKSMQGLGEISGANSSFPNTENYIEDPDFIDTWFDSGFDKGKCKLDSE